MCVNIGLACIVQLDVLNASFTKLVDARLLQAVSNPKTRLRRTELAIGIIARNLSKGKSTYKCNDQES